MKILMATIGSYGDVNPYVALGQELLRRGHQPTIATAMYYQELIEKTGIKFTPLRPEGRVDDVELVKRVLNQWRGSEAVVRELVMPMVREMYQDLEGPAATSDLLVSHMLTYAVPILGEKTGKPWISTILAPLGFFSRYDVPVLPPAPWLAPLTRSWGPGFNSWFLRQLKRVSYSWSEPARALRQELGLGPGLDPIWEGQHSPLKVLALFSPHFASPQPDWPAHTRACGFPFLDDRNTALDPDLENFLAKGEAPLIFTLGSSAVMIAKDFYEQAAQAAQRLNKRAVLVAGPQTEALSRRFTSNIKAVSWAAFPALFEKGAVIIHPGGIGTTAQALRSGRPQLVVPFANDQFDNADHVKRLGLGAVLHRRKVNPQRLEKALSMILVDSKMSEAAQKMGQLIQSENGVATACDEIEASLPALKI